MVPLTVVRMSVNPPNVCGAPLEIPATRSNRLGVVRLPVLGRFSWFQTKRPTRTSHTVFVDKVCVRCPKVIAGTDAVRRSVASNGVATVGRSGFTQDSL